MLGEQWRITNNNFASLASCIIPALKGARDLVLAQQSANITPSADLLAPLFCPRSCGGDLYNQSRLAHIVRTGKKPGSEYRQGNRRSWMTS